MARTTALVVGDPFQMHSGGASTQDCVCVRERKSTCVWGQHGQPSTLGCVCVPGDSRVETPL